MPIRCSSPFMPDRMLNENAKEVVLSPAGREPSSRGRRQEQGGAVGIPSAGWWGCPSAGYVARASPVERYIADVSLICRKVRTAGAVACGRYAAVAKGRSAALEEVHRTMEAKPRSVARRPPALKCHSTLHGHQQPGIYSCAETVASSQEETETGMLLVGGCRCS